MSSPEAPSHHVRRLLQGAAALVATIGLLLATPGTAFAAIPPTQVVPDSVNLAGPSMVDLNGKFWAYGSNRPRLGGKVPIYMAENLTGPYSYQGKAIADIPWAKDKSAVFGPDVRHMGGDRLVMYFSATPVTYDNHHKCIGIAVSNNGPAGPFVAQDEPIKCAARRGGTIDPSFFKDRSTGHNWVLYKTNHKQDDPTDPLREIWAMRISDDGLRRVGDPVHLIGRRTNIENPQLLLRSGTYILIVSRNKYRTYNYNTSSFTSPTLNGTYTGERAFITTENSKAAGPGGADIVYIEENNVGHVAVFHGWEKEGTDCYVRRPMWIAEIGFGADNTTPRLLQQGSGPTPTC